MSNHLLSLLNQIQSDPWREANEYSEDIKAVNEVLFSSVEEKAKQEVLSKWLAGSGSQPCLFGRIAAKLNLISYCFITEADLSEGDEAVQNKIQEARTDWTRKGHLGDKSAFIILLISQRIASGCPSPIVKDLARRLCAHYLLLDNISYDAVLTDEIYLTKPGRQDVVWKWLCGVNYFCTQADGRWWQDHRIPGGLAFSVNSVGHMVKSAQLKISMQIAEKMLNAPGEDWAASNVSSLEEALKFAMLTISNASPAVSGKATELRERSENSDQPSCPFKLPANLEKFDPCQYSGFYHTDVTLPSEYFLSDVERPSNIRPQNLDFTYLFNDAIENPAHITMGQGRQIRAIGQNHAAVNSVPNEKPLKAAASTVRIDQEPRLRDALRGM